MAGVAPNITLVNLRAGQDSGFFFLQGSVDAFTYAGDHGIDVVNMSYFVDPWLYNCGTRCIRARTRSQSRRRRRRSRGHAACDRLRVQHGVTMVAAAGNGHENIDHATADDQSPDSRSTPTTTGPSTTHASRCLARATT